MEALEVNMLAVIVGTIASMMLGAVWYGPLFGKHWMKIIGVDPDDADAKKKMQKSAGPLYIVQALLAFFQVLVLAHLIADTTRVGGIERALWIWAAFVIPTLFGAVMWTNESAENKRARLLIQGGYQFVLFLVFGILLQYWK